MGNFKSFGYYSEFLIGVGYFFIGYSFIYYGDKVAQVIKNPTPSALETDKSLNESLGFKVSEVSLKKFRFFYLLIQLAVYFYLKVSAEF